MSAPPRIRRGTLRADGLASMQAGAGGGEFVTPLLRMAEGDTNAIRLHINFATSAAGSVRVEILEADGKPLAEHAAADCAEIYGDEPARLVAWRGSSALPAKTEFRLRFELRDADLYSISLR